MPAVAAAATLETPDKLAAMLVMFRSEVAADDRPVTAANPPPAEPSRLATSPIPPPAPPPLALTLTLMGLRSALACISAWATSSEAASASAFSLTLTPSSPSAFILALAASIPVVSASSLMRAVPDMSRMACLAWSLICCSLRTASVMSAVTLACNRSMKMVIVGYPATGYVPAGRHHGAAGRLPWPVVRLRRRR